MPRSSKTSSSRTSKSSTCWSRPTCARSGVGRAMLERVCAFLAEARPYPEVWLRVSRDNAPAAACASAAGFEAVAKMSGPRYQWYKKRLISHDTYT